MTNLIKTFRIIAGALFVVSLFLPALIEKSLTVNPAPECREPQQSRCVRVSKTKISCYPLNPIGEFFASKMNSVELGDFCSKRMGSENYPDYNEFRDGNTILTVDSTSSWPGLIVLIYGVLSLVLILTLQPLGLAWVSNIIVFFQVFGGGYRKKDLYRNILGAIFSLIPLFYMNTELSIPFGPIKIAHWGIGYYFWVVSIFLFTCVFVYEYNQKRKINSQ